MNLSMWLRTADGYLLVAENLYQTQRNSVAFLRYYISPFAVNCTCACELYLKYLYFKQNGTPTKEHHQLLNIYNQLHADTKLQIKTEYEKLASILSLEQCLATHNLAFVEWRYLYEGKTPSVDTKSLYNLAISLHNVCLLSNEEANSDAH